MSQWAEIRHQHLVEGVAKKQIARRLQLDIKTVRRAVEQPTPPVRASSPRVRSLDPWREQIAQWLDQDRRLTAKRIRRLLLPLAGPVAARTVRRYVAALKVATAPKEGYVHRSVRPGTTMEVDFGESWAEVAGVPRKVKYLVATLPYSNVYFAKAYPLERLESLLDGIESAFTYFGGVVDGVVLDNTVLCTVPAARAADAVYLHRPARSQAMGNLPDEAARRLSAASHSAASPRCRIRRGGVRPHRARRRGRQDDAGRPKRGAALRTGVGSCQRRPRLLRAHQPRPGGRGIHPLDQRVI